VLHDRPAVARGRDGTRGRATTAMSWTCSGCAGDAPGALATAAHDRRGRGVPRLPHDRRGPGTGQEAAAPALRTRRPRSAPVRAVRVGPLHAWSRPRVRRAASGIPSETRAFSSVPWSVWRAGRRLFVLGEALLPVRGSCPAGFPPARLASERPIRAVDGCWSSKPRAFRSISFTYRSARGLR